MPETDSLDDGAPGLRPGRFAWWQWVERGLLGLIAVLAIGFRFATKSPLWLDEALSANIASLPLGEIASALRHDGHPPLYYYLLHFWMDLFGNSDLAVRSLSGLFGLALFPLAWQATKRLGGRRAATGTVFVLALSPYALRYSTETRMYSLVMVLALAAWLLADRCLANPKLSGLAGLALLCGALLWTHYWALWLLGAAGAGLLVHAWRAQRAGRRDDLNATLRVVGALVAGGLLFLPWLPTLLYQASHTGTPWADPVRPTELLAQGLLDLGGGPPGEAVLLAIVLVMLILLALFGRALDGRHIELDLHTRPESRPMLILIGGTLAIGSMTSLLTGSAFATRYLAVVVPLILVVAGLGLARFVSPIGFRLVLAAVLLLGAAGGIRNVITDRTQAGDVAVAYRRQAQEADLVVICPDQLGPALSRELPDEADVVTYPDFSPPELVDWVDYDERMAAADPASFGGEALKKAGERTIWYAWSGTYKTHQGTCEALLNEMLSARPWGNNVVVEDGEAFFEHESLWRLPAVADG